MKETAWDQEEYFEYARNLFDPGKISGKPELLSGVRVLDVGTQWLGPMCAGLLAELGAEVIKFELPPDARPGLPEGGDTLRWLGPTGPDTQNTSLPFFCANRNKRHVTLDLSTPKGKEIFRELAARPDTDVIVENLRAGGMDRLGLGYRQLSRENPRLIYLASNGPGQWGPLADMLGDDGVGQAMSGHVHVTGFPDTDSQYPGIPTLMGSFMADTVGAIWGYSAVLAALLYREKTGKGQFIELSQVEGLLRILNDSIERYSVNNEVTGRLGNRRANLVAPAYVTSCKDGYVYLVAVEKQFQGLCGAMGRPDLVEDPRFLTGELRLENQAALYELIDAWCLTKTKEELRRIAVEANFVLSPVLDPKEICELPHFLERGAIAEIDDRHYGRMKLATMPTHFSETPARVKHVSRPIGADNEAIFGKYLGYTRQDLGKLRKEKVI